MLSALFLGTFASIGTYPVNASNDPGIPLYLHHLPGNVTVSGVQTSQILNTTTLWDNPPPGPNLRYNVFNFTLYPALTSSMTSIGPGSIVLWITVSGAPGSLNATIYDASAAGQLAVVSTSAVITLNSSPTVPYKEVLGFNINHTFTQSSTIKLSLTVFKVSQLYVWYDSSSYQSALTIPVSNIPRITQIETFNANFTPATSFSLNSTSSQRIVFLVVHVADPFGSYHVANATVTITNPTSTAVFTGIGTSLTINPAAPSKLFAISWPYSASLPNGTYTINATGEDIAGDQASDMVSVLLTSVYAPPPSNPPPTNPPPTLQPPNSTWPTIYWLIIGGGLAALLGALLAFLLLTRRRGIICSKCHSRVNHNADKCPFCGNLLAHPDNSAELSNPQTPGHSPNLPAQQSSGQAANQPVEISTPNSKPNDNPVAKKDSTQ